MDGFRFICSWDDFVHATDLLHKMLEEKKAFLLFGMQSDINLKICCIEELESSVKEIIRDEILYLIRDGINSKGIFDTEELREFLISEEVDDKREMEDIITEVKNKFEYVYEVIISSDVERRYLFKRETVLNKISKLKCNYSNYILDNGEMHKHAIIQLGVSKDMSSLENNAVNRMIGKCSDEVVSFACDLDDLDYLIYLLNKIKKEMEEL